jgi:radical SAM superfamily enzyme YgiQ (UPF0313 family)
MKKVTLVELTAFDKIIPLASAYLKSFALTDPAVAEGCDIEIYDAPVTVDREKLADELIRHGSDVYGISCYLWNMELVRWLLDRLSTRFPQAEFILGGPQVMSHAAHYLTPDQTNIAVCNGEGERTFQAYLRQLISGAPDFEAVPGLSFWRDGELVTTERPPRIADLTEIPSPFTGGMFEKGKYTFAILETNRGCPYNCGFCFWGAATNAKVNKFETQRVLDDIEWMSDNGFGTIFLADANWGLAPRDVDFTRHMIECKKKTGYPLVVSMNAAKNKPDRVAEITKILVDGGLLTSQPISLQSMDSGVLDLINRSNIRSKTYTELQKTLRDQNISSYIEMIWPLPGETTRTFRDGITELCRSRADTILVYPQLLLHNTPTYESRDQFGIRVRRVPDEVAEAEVVVETNWVTEADYERGVWLYYAMLCLYNQRGLYYLANHLDRTGALSFGELYSAAVEFFERRQDAEICRFMAESVRGLGNYFLLNAGEFAHRNLYSQRDEFTALLHDFVSTQPFWDDPDAQAAFELDLLARPYIYRESAPRVPAYSFQHLRVEQERNVMTVTVPAAPARLLAELDVADLDPEAGEVVLRLRHPGRQKLPYLRHRSLEDNIAYCQGMTLHLREMLAEWTPLRPATVG